MSQPKDSNIFIIMTLAIGFLITVATGMFFYFRTPVPAEIVISGEHIKSLNEDVCNYIRPDSMFVTALYNTTTKRFTYVECTNGIHRVYLESVDLD